MFSAFRGFMSGYHEYAVGVSRRRALQQLRRLDERLLADSGFSRRLLEQGVEAWPWREKEARQPPMTVRPSSGEVAQAIRELQAYSDAELMDLGISRIDIAEAVHHGRPGVDDEIRRAA